jgi:hypothetical protein
MTTNKFQPFFDGYLRAVLTSFISLYALLIVSIGVIDWDIFVFVFLVIAAGVMHFIFLIVLYMLVFPLISAVDAKASHYSLRGLMDRYIPIIALPFAIFMGLCWENDILNMWGVFILLDILFTTYIGLYYYLKNKCKRYETA